MAAAHLLVFIRRHFNEVNEAIHADRIRVDARNKELAGPTATVKRCQKCQAGVQEEKEKKQKFMNCLGIVLSTFQTHPAASRNRQFPDHHSSVLHLAAFETKGADAMQLCTSNTGKELGAYYEFARRASEIEVQKT